MPAPPAANLFACYTGAMSQPRKPLDLLLGPMAVYLGRAPHPCNYLPGRQATDEAWISGHTRPAAYHELMNRGFRRSGHILYRPVCEGCNACVPLRVPVAEFEPSRSQRRVLRRNTDVILAVNVPRLTPEKHDLYVRYLRAQHPGSEQGQDEENLREFLYSTCTDTLEFEFRDRAGRLLGVTIADMCEHSLSSVYHYFEPEEARRSVGVYSVLREIQWCRESGIPHYYLGFWVRGCRAMEYKADYQPHELLHNGRWTRPRA